MDALNYDWFRIVNANTLTPDWLMWLAYILAVYAIMIIPVILVLGWIRRDKQQQQPMLRALVGCGCALLINALIAHFWFSPRPFMIPIGHTFLHHRPDASFPSDHMTIVMTVAFSLIYQWETRKLGIGIALLGLLIGWSRVFLGVHFPMDMVGGTVVALISSALAYRLNGFYMPALYQCARKVYQVLFAPLIKRGWISR
ncbi:putative undecaprenyl-diphosphatase YbjG [Halomonadaceae bacterium LMG 33818]